MSNGTACCAAEICCDPPGARAKITATLVAKGMDAEYCQVLFDWMDEESLMFADTSLRPFLHTVVKMARR